MLKTPTAKSKSATKFFEETRGFESQNFYFVLSAFLIIFIMSFVCFNAHNVTYEKKGIVVAEHEEHTAYSENSCNIVDVIIDVDVPPLSAPSNNNTSYMTSYVSSSQVIEEDSEECIVPIEEDTEEYIVPIEKSDIELLVQAVQHEVGSEANYYPNDDLDVIQQCMTRVIINRIEKEEFADSIYEILSTPGHFMPLEELTEFDSEDERTTQNVLTVLNGEDNLSEDIIFEMSFISLDIEHNLDVMEEQVGPVELYMSAITADGRCLIFAEPDNANL